MRLLEKVNLGSVGIVDYILSLYSKKVVQDDDLEIYESNPRELLHDLDLEREFMIIDDELWKWNYNNI